MDGRPKTPRSRSLWSRRRKPSKLFLLLDADQTIDHRPDNLALLNTPPSVDDELLRKLVERIGGEITWREDTRILLVFDDPFAGIRLASEAREANDEYRIILHTGRIVFRDGKPWGPTFDVATFLSHAAQPGQTLVSGAFRQQLGSDDVAGADLFSYGPRQVLPGHDPQEVCELSFAANPTPALALGSTNLPPRSSRLVAGREEDEERLVATLSSRSAVNLTGPPGMGKTTLALEFARRWRTDNADQHVWHVDFSSAEDLPGAIAVLSDVLDLPLSTSAGPDEVVAVVGEAVRQAGPSLVVLDHLDWLADDAVTVLERLLPQTDHTRWLLVSRRAVRPTGSSAVELGPLSLDAGLALLVERLERVRPETAFTEAALDTAAQIVRDAEGIPLVIELAAAPARLWSLGDVAQWLRTSEREGPLDRVLRTAWNELTPDQARVLTACSVFETPFTSESLQLLLGEDVGETLLELLDASLLARVAGDVAQDAAMRVLGPVADTIGRLGDPATRAEAEERHLDMFATLAESWAKDCASPRHAVAMRQIADRASDLRSAYRRAAAPGDPRAVPLALALNELYLIQNPDRQEIDVLSRAIEIAADCHQRLLPTCHLRRGHARYLVLDAEGGLADAEQAMSLLDDDDRDMVSALRLASRSAMATGEPARAREYGVRAMARAEKIGPSRELALALYERAALLLDGADHEPAIPIIDRGITAAEADGDPFLCATLYGIKGRASLHSGRFRDAKSYLQRALETYREFGIRRAETLTLLDRAEVDIELGDINAALASAFRALHLCRLSSMPDTVAWAEGTIGLAYMHTFDCPRARRHFASALDGLEGDAYRPTRGLFLSLLAAVNACDNRVGEARQQFGEAEEAMEELDQPAWKISRDIYRESLSLATAVDREERRKSQRRIDDLVESEEVDYLARRAHRWVTGLLTHTRPEADSDPEELVVGAEARWFRAPAGERVDISRRTAPRLILRELTRARLDSKGEPLSGHDLVAAGWPGEKIEPTSARNRLYVAIATLRNLGLRELLVTEGDGYMIAPTVSVKQAESG